MKQVNEYNYEASYNKQNKALEMLEQKRYLDSKQKGLKYVVKIIESGDLLETAIYPYLSIMPRTAPPTRRTESRLCQKLLNKKRAKKYLNRLVHLNFGKNDYFVTLTYSDDYLPNSISEAKKNVANYFRRINSTRKGEQNIKYIFVTEYGEKNKRIHHHAIIEGSVKREVLEAKWRQGEVNIKPLDPDKGYSYLVKYIMKSPKGKKAWNPSRGLKKPIIKKDYSGFGDDVVRKWCFGHSSIDDEILNWKELKKYGHLRIKESPEVVISPVNNGYYIYLQMIRD